MKLRYFLFGLLLSALIFCREQLFFAIFSAVRPIFQGVLIALFLSPVACFLEKRLPFKKASLKRAVSLCLLAFFILLLIVLCLLLLVPAIKKSFSSVYELFTASLTALQARYPSVFSLLQKSLSSLPQTLSLQQRIGDTAAGVADFFIGLIAAFLLLYHRQALFFAFDQLIGRLWGEERAKKISHILHTAVRVFGSFFLGQLSEALVIGSGCLLFSLLFSLPFALEISLFIALTAIIPAAGALVGTAVGVLVLLSESIQQAAVFLLFMILLQWVDNLFIYPKVVGKTVGVSTLGTLAAVILGGKLMGAAGVLLFVPLVGTLKALYPLNENYN